MSAQIAVEIEATAARLARLKPISTRNPHAFFEDRSEIAHDLRSLAEWLRTGRRPADLVLDAERPVR